MKRTIPFAFATITVATLIGCESTQTTASIPMTPIVPIEANVGAAETPLTPLAIGDDAPAISIDHWVKGDAIGDFEDGQVYVMEFWATWCPPCITSMPHLSGLQDKYGDAVKIIGVSSEKELETVTTFLEETNKSDNMLNSDRMRYTVTVDPDRSTSRVFMEAAGQKYIPTAFIINGDGKVAWIGSPRDMDDPLEQVVNGTWDLAAATETFAVEKAEERAKMELQKVYTEAVDNDEWDGWITAIDTYTEEYGNNARMNSMKFDALLTGKKDKEAAYAWAQIMLASSWDNPNTLNAFARNILDETPAELQDLDYALEVATRASELTNNEDATILDTLARAYWELGDWNTAIDWQEKAVGYAQEGTMADNLQTTLSSYTDELEAKIEAAKPPALAIGDDAPAISIDHWVKGAAISDFEDGQVYVMEFWATWCGPCIRGIPHLTEIQEQYADDNVNVIGCAIWQREDTQDARKTKVSAFVEDQGDKMNYTVAVDNESWMSDNWMKPAGRNGIPSAFIINGDGKVAWIGHPAQMDEPLEQVVNGTWDLAAATETFAAELAEKRAMDEMRTAYMAARKKFDALLTGKKDKEAAYAWAQTMLAPMWDNPSALNAFAWNILDETPAELQDLDYALKVATRASELTENKNPMILDTLARAYWELGETYKAIAWQQKAVEFSDGEMGDSIVATLEEYETSLASVEVK